MNHFVDSEGGLDLY